MWLDTCRHLKRSETKIFSKNSVWCSFIKSAVVLWPRQLRPRQHDRQLIPKTTKLYSCNFVIRMLYKHSYLLFIVILTIVIFTIFLLYKLRFDSLILNEDDDDDDDDDDDVW